MARRRQSILAKRIQRFVGVSYDEAREILHEGVICPWCDQDYRKTGDSNLAGHIAEHHDRGLEDNRVEHDKINLSRRGHVV